MPIGVPRVAHRNVGDGNPGWIDVYNRLYRDRIFFLGQEVDSDIANQLIGLLLYLTIENDTQEMVFLINSPGGWVLPGIALYDAIQFVGPDVHTMCIGLAASMGSFLLAAGTITKRVAFPHARVMIHQPASYFFDSQASEFILEAEELLKLRESITSVYAQRTGKPFWVISEDMERDVFMSATEAQAHGIVDVVTIK
uniref:ATP-dependent Clp protease proteolytic subunit n=2 Tax=Firmiana TaxID=190242 RepID=A0A872ZN08_9ROSI|nr:ATP-dependent protease proteolytic subuni [Firmiana colorata]YP_010959811.1 clp protease proteolytic subunit [Firmiana kwangsiensis]QOY45238.1 ATP-dependent protease proteolytic subuni [Firmiana simplex]QOY45154.1 ATP-dependent protease proteolytic subuni [Firmiana colorata]WNE93776.1 clp protease proteolytic subunit [Firmiana kwangsiensis]DAC80200.1 TPA_asm: ATP-dependent Clp protease proteolytic subunit [Firmiana colorata]